MYKKIITYQSGSKPRVSKNIIWALHVLDMCVHFLSKPTRAITFRSFWLPQRCRFQCIDDDRETKVASGQQQQPATATHTITEAKAAIPDSTHLNYKLKEKPPRLCVVVVVAHVVVRGHCLCVCVEREREKRAIIEECSLLTFRSANIIIGSLSV